LSKSGCKRSNQTLFPPSAWWTCNKRLREKVRKEGAAIGTPTIAVTDAATIYDLVFGTADGGSVVTYTYVNIYANRDRYALCYGEYHDQRKVFDVIRTQLSASAVTYQAGATGARKSRAQREVRAFEDLLVKDPELAKRPLRFEEVAALFAAHKVSTA
jgi:hypothetical protein